MPKIKINNITRTLLKLRGYAYGEPYEGVVDCDQPHSFDLNDEDVKILLRGLEMLTLLGALNYCPAYLVTDGACNVTKEDVRWASNITKLQKVAKHIMGNDNDKTESD